MSNPQAAENQTAEQILNVSMPPVPLVKGRPATIADVLLKIVTDGPLYAVFLLMGLLVWKGHANTLEAILGSAMGLLANSNPSWRDKFKVGAMAVVIIGAAFIAACGIPARPAAYGVDLQQCNEKARSCQESIDCENFVRVKYNRPLRLYDNCGATIYGDAGVDPFYYPWENFEAGARDGGTKEGGQSR